MFDALGRFAIGQFRKLLGGTTATTADRTLSIDAESRTLSIVSETRTTNAEQEARTLSINEETRTATIKKKKNSRQKNAQTYFCKSITSL